MNFASRKLSTALLLLLLSFPFFHLLSLLVKQTEISASKRYSANSKGGKILLQFKFSFSTNSLELCLLISYRSEKPAKLGTSNSLFYANYSWYLIVIFENNFDVLKLLQKIVWCLWRIVCMKSVALNYNVLFTCGWIVCNRLIQATNCDWDQK